MARKRPKTESWKAIEETLAEETGLAITIVEGADSEVVSESNNNSICARLYGSPEFGERCAQYCGKAFEQAVEADSAVAVKCHAGLHYSAVPLKMSGKTELVAIVGRAFVKTGEYKEAVARSMEGDWQGFSQDQLFENVLLASSSRAIDQAVKHLENLSAAEKRLLASIGEPEAKPLDEQSQPELSDEARQDELSRLIEKFHQAEQSKESGEKSSTELEELSEWRSLFGSLLDLSYKDACVRMLQFLSTRYGIKNLAWLERKNENLETVLASGSFKDQAIQLSISAGDERLLDVVNKHTALELRERSADRSEGEAQRILLFPIAVGGEVRSALVAADVESNKKLKGSISRFIQGATSELEILRLRGEIERQAWLSKAVKRLNDTLKNIDTDDFWELIAQVSAELLMAERGSLLMFDEASDELTVQAAIGVKAHEMNTELSEKIGERIAKNVLRSGRPLVVKDMHKVGILPSPANWKYKTKSFISYPIIIGGRKIGVLNMADKTDGSAYDEFDLELLHTLAPQLAIALDRTSLKRKAGEFEQLSITDPLTGLVNRRYLEERLSEEVSRSQRHGYPMSFMMIDVDEFKSYNDTYTHPEGDKALQLVGQCLKSTLRGADIAARYGGEEFSILLPQTTLDEAVTIAERVRQKIESTTFPNRQVTVSIGVSSCSSDLCDVKKLISAADKALYESKDKGRNHVSVYDGQGNGTAEAKV